ncbi:IclR family transcriptional regulator [Oceanobacillus jeddahense]|uniref:IclR family transcriptional regulator n=1 Tax=Oceanobacillus jeddahense TaxID=1462527 RepID=A0ABY5JRW9_9BACI|nr:IclR family transcriptional regulator [Oceanobacillus jeddahense]UUI03073.1 IclR family transcriptional regulator [Oceanobacillus jeddahense]
MQYQNKSLGKSFDIIESLCREPKTATELSMELGLNPTTLHRFIMTLQEMGIVEKLNDNKLRMSYQFINLGKMAETHYDIAGDSKPFLEALAKESGESVLISTFQNFSVSYLSKVESSHAIRIVLDPGDKVPSYTVASGKLFLSSLDETLLHKFLAKVKLEKKTENTITTKEALLKELQEIRERGYAIDNEEYLVGLKGMAAPIYNSTGNVVAALSVAGVALRLDNDKTTSIAERLLYYANKISNTLGWFPEESNN